MPTEYQRYCASTPSLVMKSEHCSRMSEINQIAEEHVCIEHQKTTQAVYMRVRNNFGVLTDETNGKKTEQRVPFKPHRII